MRSGISGTPRRLRQCGWMCGIAGLAGFKDANASEAALCAMVNAIERRGPDSEGIARWPGARLGHRRLAIIDLSEGGHQPMLSDNGRVGLVFNGCIYNFLELRKELEKLGHAFRSASNTEVLLRGYEEWGIDALVPRLRGMFAFGMGRRERVAVAGRDRLGVKPRSIPHGMERLPSPPRWERCAPADLRAKSIPAPCSSTWNSEALRTIARFIPASRSYQPRRSLNGNEGRFLNAPTGPWRSRMRNRASRLRRRWKKPNACFSNPCGCGFTPMCPRAHCLAEESIPRWFAGPWQSSTPTSLRLR